MHTDTLQRGLDFSRLNDRIIGTISSEALKDVTPIIKKN